MTPKVSIVMPVYNVGRYLEQTLASLAQQTFRDFEVIAVNDGSTDDSAAILERWAERDRRIRVFHQKNAGLVGVLNRGLSEASAELIARADGDDVYPPERLQRQFDYITSRDDVVLLGARTIKIDAAGRVLYHEFQPVAHEEILRGLTAGFGGVLPHSVSMYRKSLVAKIGGYREEAKDCEDTDLWLRLAEVGKLCNLPEHLVQYRVHHSSVSATQWRDRRADAERIVRGWAMKHNVAIAEDTFWDRPPQTPASLARFWASQAIRQGNRAAAIRQSLYSLRREPHRLVAWKTLASVLKQSRPRLRRSFALGLAESK